LEEEVMPDIEITSIGTGGKKGPHVWQVTDRLNAELRKCRFDGLEESKALGGLVLRVDKSTTPDTKAISIMYGNPNANWQVKDAVNETLAGVEGSRLTAIVEVSPLGAVALINYPTAHPPEFPRQAPYLAPEV
jgi:hypothetical protein